MTKIINVQDPIVLRHHIFSDDFNLTPIECKCQLSRDTTLYVAVQKNTNKKYLLLKSSLTFGTEDYRFLYLNHAERATELIHPVLLPLLGFSDTAPNLYFDYYPEILRPITDEQLINLDLTSIKIIILGVLSGLSYLIERGFSIPELTLNSIFYSKENGPKFVNYVNYNALDMDYSINQYVEQCDQGLILFHAGIVIRELLNHRRRNEFDELLPIPKNLDPNFARIIEGLIDVKREPKISDAFQMFRELFKNDDPLIAKYLKKLDSADKFRYDYRMDKKDYVPFKILKDEAGNYYSNKFFDNDVNILHSCYIQEDVFSHKEYFPLLNRLPDSEIKLLLENQKNPPKDMYEYLCYEKEYLLLPPEFRSYFYSSRPEINYLIYQKLMEKSKTENDPNLAIYPIALKHLKAASKGNHIEAKIRLAIHYLKGDIVPANISKALLNLKRVAFQNQISVSRYIDPVNEKEKQIEKEIRGLSNELKALIVNAERTEKPLELLYLAFAFHAGIDTFPVSPSRSVYYYRQAAKKSASCMCLLGGLYLQGYIFPRNLYRARNCFKKAALNGSFKAKILDSLMRKHIWRYYLSDVGFENIYKRYLECPESLSFDDSLIFPEVNYLIANQQDLLINTSPFMNSYFFYDQRNDLGIVKKNEMKLAINSLDFKVPTLPDNKLKQDDIKIMQLYSFIHTINKMLSSNILPQQLYPVFHHKTRNVVVNIFSKFLSDKFGYIFEENNEDEGDIAKENKEKFGITKDMEYGVASFIQSKYIPQIDKDGEFKCSSISFIPQISLPSEEQRLNELKEVIDKCLQEVLPDINEKDKDGYFVANFLEQDEADIEYFQMFEEVLKNTIRDHMVKNEVCKNFVSDIDLFEVFNSEPIIYSAKITNLKEYDSKAHLSIGDSYFFGENGFPVNYTEAAKYYQMAANQGNPEAQWKFGTLKVMGLGTRQDGKNAEFYLRKSANQNESDGMLRYSLFIRHFLINHEIKEDIKWPPFRGYLERSAEAGNIEAINQLGMLIESNYDYDEIEKSIEKFDDAVSRGLIDSVYRIIHIYDNPNNKRKYRNLVRQSIGLCENDIIMRMIEIYNHKKRYEQSNRLINAGLCFDRDVFLPNHAKHVVLYSSVGSIRDRLNYAKSLLMPTLRHPSETILKRGFLEMYLMAMITILSKANEYEEACELLIENINCLTLKSKNEYIDFYMHINKKVARQYQLSINSYLPEYRCCVEAFQLIKQKGIHVKEGNDKLKLILQENSSNQFALLQRGKILLKNHLMMRRNISKALDLIQRAAKQNCPEARFEYGKELYYGLTLPMDRWKAFQYFKKAFDKTNQDPRAGYFLSKKCFISRNLITQEEADCCLEVAARSGYRRALFRLGKKLYNEQRNKTLIGIILIKKARDQQYQKSIDFLDEYESRITYDESFQENDNQAYFAFAKELYYGRIIEQDIKMAFIIFMKFFNNDEPDLRAGYFLSKKKFIQRELITPSAARNALVISAKSHYRKAQFRLGKLYYAREGKTEKGLALLRKAKKQNYKKAIDYLEEIKNQELRKIQTDESSIFIPQKLLRANFSKEKDEEEKLENGYLNRINNDNEEEMSENIKINNGNENANNKNRESIKKLNENSRHNTIPIREFKFDDEKFVPNEKNDSNMKIGSSSSYSVKKPKKQPSLMKISSSKIRLTSIKLNKTSASRFSDDKDINQPLLSKYNEENTENKEKEEKPKSSDNLKSIKQRINLNDEVTSDFSDEPEEDYE